MSDIEKTIAKAEKLLAASEEARGTSKELINAGPIEIRMYNIATQTMNSLSNYIAVLKDANGTYMKDKK